MAGNTNKNGNKPNALTFDGNTSLIARAVGSRKTGNQITSNNSADLCKDILSL